jgi:hypothetical protein
MLPAAAATQEQAVAETLLSETPYQAWLRRDSGGAREPLSATDVTLLIETPL